MHSKKTKHKVTFILMAVYFILFEISANVTCINQIHAKSTKKTVIKLNYTKKTLLKGKTVQLKLKGAKVKVIWSTNKKSVAEVSPKGLVKAKGQGTAMITARAGGKYYRCKITVKPPKGSKGNPYSAFLYQEISYYHPSLKTPCTFGIQLTDYQEGEKANRLMQIYSSNNPIAKQGQKWIVMKFAIKYIAGPEESWPASALLNPKNSFYRQDGRRRIKSLANGDYGSFENNGIYKSCLRLNQASEILVAYLTEEETGYPLFRIPVGFDERKNAMEYYWFTTEK